MKSRDIFLPLALVLSLILPTAAQKRQDVDELIRLALESNSEVLLAEARVREAQAALNQARQVVTREVISAFNRDRTTAERLDVALRHYERLQKRYEAGAAPADQVSEALLGYVEAKEQRALIAGEMQYLLGSGPGALQRATRKDLRLPSTTPSAIPEAFKPDMEKVVTLDGAAETLDVAVASLGVTSGVIFVTAASIERHPIAKEKRRTNVPANAKLSLASALRLLADVYDVRFVLRDYGVLVTTPDDAQRYSEPVIF